MIRPAAAALLALALSALGPGCADADLPAQAVGDYAVYSAILEDGFVQPGRVVLVVHGDHDPLAILETAGDVQSILESMHEQGVAVTAVTLQELLQAGAPAPLQAQDFSVSAAVRVLTADEWAQLFSPSAADSWERFQAAFPGADGYISLSRIVYGPDQHLALVYVSRRCGFLCGSGGLWVLEKQGERWIKLGEFATWMS